MEMTKRQTGVNCSFSLRGQFTFNDHELFRDVLNQIVQKDTGHVVLHMAQVDFIDSSGLGMLLIAQDEADRYRKTLIIDGVAGQVKKIFAMARFGNIFTIVEAPEVKGGIGEA